ncbi:hypothetical protein [Microbacterium sp. W4I20]|uniref:hypothetical protein n=1 Tax=Microbacterium sp. W4I20 TaxID=3042262 RepID=UPI00278A7ADD|nr:hypothetical protein [Microbacterium sp. W4I20]MDQ0729169.1 hypothetical protein [Microbacterium sp. W4I20]
MGILEEPEREQHSIARRTIVKAAAWSVPVIAVAVSTPLAAASTAEPQPAPGGGLSVWQGGTSVQTWTITQPNRVQVNTGQNVGFNAFDANTGDIVPPGTYRSGLITVTVQWGPGNGVPEPADYRLEERSLSGWTRVGAAPAPGASGTVQYTYVGVLNGSANIVPLPVVWLIPVSGGALEPTYVNTSLSSEFLSEKTSGSRVP